MLIGRKNEQQRLLNLLKSNKSEFVAVYGVVMDDLFGGL